MTECKTLKEITVRVNKDGQMTTLGKSISVKLKKLIT